MPALVHDDYGSIGHDRVDHATVRPGIAKLGSDKPVAENNRKVRITDRVVVDRTDPLFDRLFDVEFERLGSHACRDEMHVRFDEPRKQQLSFEIEKLCRFTDQSAGTGRIADVNDGVAPDDDGFGKRVVGVDRVDVCIDESQVAVFDGIVRWPGAGRQADQGEQKRREANHDQVRISLTPASPAINKTSAGRWAKRPTVTTPGMRLIRASMSIGLAICRS